MRYFSTLHPSPSPFHLSTSLGAAWGEDIPLSSCGCSPILIAARAFSSCGLGPGVEALDGAWGRAGWMTGRRAQRDVPGPKPVDRRRMAFAARLARRLPWLQPSSALLQRQALPQIARCCLPVLCFPSSAGKCAFFSFMNLGEAPCCSDEGKC